MKSSGEVEPAGCAGIEHDCVVHAGVLMITILAVAAIVSNAEPSAGLQSEGTDLYASNTLMQ